MRTIHDKGRRNPLIRLAASQPKGALGDADDNRRSRVAQPSCSPCRMEEPMATVFGGPREPHLRIPDEAAW
jgi:hypothetical protein